MRKRTGFILGAAAAAGAVMLAREYRKAAQEQSLADEVALVTGGSRGLGLALARELARNGCRIAICARDQAELNAAIADLQSRGAEAFAFPCDISKKEDVQRLIAAVRQYFGRIDILVNNAGVIQVGPVESLDTEDFDLAMNTIFWGTVHPTLEVLPEFLDRGTGRIVNISSIGGKLGIPHLLPYTSAKFAVAGFSQALAAEMGSRGISVTAIYPGLMRTGSFVQAQFKGNQTEEAEWFTLGATLPGISMDTDRAARQIVSAIKRGETEATLSLPAKAAALVNKLFPGGVTEMLALATSAILPDPRSSGDARKGSDIWSTLPPVVRALSALGVHAMKHYNQRTQPATT